MTRAHDDRLGRYLVLFADDATDAGTRAMTDAAGLRATDAESLVGSGITIAGTSDGVFWHNLGLAVVTAASEQVEALTDLALQRGPVAMIEPERTVYAIGATTNGSVHTTTGGEHTWGLHAVHAATSTATGAGERIAVLDTGFDLRHPDFDGRTLLAESFVTGTDVADGHGHGTHVTGTACGPRAPVDGPGYGIAPQSEIAVGKVLDDSGAGTDGDILAGIAWAVQQECAVVSMSLGAPAEPGQTHSAILERAARRAMQRGTLLVAAAGNESRRADGHVAPVGHPANCPTVLAVGAVDANRAVADFSAGTVAGTGAVDLAAPGVDVYSSWPMPRRQHTISGTSMATPHVSGIAALLAEQYDARGWELWARLCQSAVRLPLPTTDVGAGLVQAP